MQPVNRYAESNLQNMLDVTCHAGRRPYKSCFDWGAYFPYAAQCVRVKKYNYVQVSDAVLQHENLISAIEQSVRDSLKTNLHDESGNIEDQKKVKYKKDYDDRRARVFKILMKMKSNLSDFSLRITSWILYKILPRFLSGIIADAKQIEMLKSHIQQNTKGTPLIFLPLHRSHLDYIVISFILLNNDIRSPIVVAGENLQLPILSSVLKSLGAFFIKRQMTTTTDIEDSLYRSVLQMYTHSILEAEHNLEFFIEGGRTRTGKPRMPKNGMMSIIVKAIVDGAANDALLVPVSINYERLVDGNFIMEQMGKRKPTESLRSTLNSIWKAFTSKYGLMKIEFNQPFSLKEFINTNRSNDDKLLYKAPSMRDSKSSLSLHEFDRLEDDQYDLIEHIGRKIVYECEVATSIMSTNAIAFLLLTRHREGVTEDVLAKDLENLTQKLSGKKRLAFYGESIQIVRYAVHMLGKDLITISKIDNQNHITPNIELPNVIELSYYKTVLDPHFALRSVVVTAMRKLSQKKDDRVTRSKLKELCRFYCDIFQYEFIFFKPTANSDMLLSESIDDLLQEEILLLPENKFYNELELRSRRLAKYVENSLWDDDNDDNAIDDSFEEELQLALDKENESEFYMRIIAPYIYTYILTVYKLVDLIGNPILESVFLKKCIGNILKQIELGICPYGESVSADSIKNCLRLLEKWGILEVNVTHNIRLLSLSSSLDSQNAIERLLEKFESIVYWPERS